MRKPNLLFIYTDEQAAGTLAPYGNDRIQMPNLNRFAAGSTVFERAYVTQPVCTPSRSSLLTGLYPHTNGCTQNNAALPADVKCLPEWLGGGYVTGHHGKWHLGDEVFAQHGFDDWISIDDGYRRYYAPGRDRDRHSTYHDFLVQNGFEPESTGKDGFRAFGRGRCARLPEAYGKPAYLAREACRFLRENRDNPFVLYVNFFEPHMPYYGPRDDQHALSDVLLPPNFESYPTPDQPLKTRLFREHYVRHGHSGLPLRTEADWRRMIANYWGLNSLVDTYAGQILDTLGELGLDGNTIVVYTSDHGDMMGSHGLIAKCVMFEEAVRVPLLVRLPGQKQGRRVSGPVSQIDLVPTLLELMGAPAPAPLQGKSLRPVLERDGGTALPDDVVIEWNGPNSGVAGDTLNSPALPDPLPDWMAEMASRSEIESALCDPVRTIVTAEGWKYAHSPRGEHELYNLNDDPGETRNLAARDEHGDVVRDLRRRLSAWQERTGDPAARI